MRQYLGLLRKIMDAGVTVQTGAYLPKEGRQPTARRLHAEQLKFDLTGGFPAITVKPLWWRAVVAELIWFLRGDGNIQYLRDQKVSSIWESWVKKYPDGTDVGDLGPVYGRQLRRQQGVRWQDRKLIPPLPTYEELKASGQLLLNVGPADEYVFEGYRYLAVPHRTGSLGHGTEHVVYLGGPHHDVVETDQIANARDDIRAVVKDPFDRARRRIILSLWNPAQVPAMALPPCHTFSFFDLEPPGRFDDAACDTFEDFEAWRKDTLDGRWTLNLHLCARSIDAVKGLPFNIASYALLCHIMAAVTDTRPGTLTITFNDVHVYDNQFPDVEEQLRREPYPAPSLHFDPEFFLNCRDLSIEDAHRLTPAMFKLVDYRHHPRLASESEVAV